MTDTVNHLTELQQLAIDDAREAVRKAQFAARLADDAVEQARADRTAATLAWAQARIDLARLVGHPLAGKRVVRPFAAFGRGCVTQRGTVTLCAYPNVSYRTYSGHTPIPGEWFIVSDSGKTAYVIPRDGIEANGWSVAG